MTGHVSLPMAKLLKKKGFDIPCREGWVNYLQSFTGETRMPDDESNLVIDRLGNSHLIERPTIADVVVWFYGNHKIWILPLPTVTGYFAYKIIDIQLDPEKPIERPPYLDVSALDYNTPWKAYEAAFDYLLNNVI